MGRFSVPLATALLTTTGCHSYHMAPAPIPPAYVRVLFAPPRPVVVTVADRDTLHLQAVTLLHGRVLSARSDTLHLAVHDVRTVNGPVPEALARRATASVPLDRGTRTEVRRVDWLETGFAMVAISALAVILFYLWAIAAVSTAST